MNINKHDIIKGLEAKGFDVKMHDVVKNGVMCEAIVFVNEQISPVIYIADILAYADIADYSLDEIIELIVDIYERAQNKKLNDIVNNITNREYIFSHIYVGVQRSGSEDIVKDFTCYEGIEAYLYIRLYDENDGFYPAKISHHILTEAKISIEDAWKAAKDNTCNETQIISMSAFLDFENTSGKNMYILTNRSRIMGASSIIDTDSIKAFAEMKGISKFALLPSSIHEFLLIPWSDDMDIYYLNQMVIEANRETVDPKEQLSDRAFILSL